MNGTEVITLPRFLEGEPLPEGYYDQPDPYVSAPSCHVNLPELAKYAKSAGKKLTDLSREEVRKFEI